MVKFCSRGQRSGWRSWQKAEVALCGGPAPEQRPRQVAAGLAAAQAALWGGGSAAPGSLLLLRGLLPLGQAPHGCAETLPKPSQNPP